MKAYVCCGRAGGQQNVGQQRNPSKFAKTKVVQRRKRRAPVDSSAQASTKLGSGEFFGESWARYVVLQL